MEKKIKKNGLTHKKIGCVLMASGKSKRFGRTNKLLAEFGGVSLIHRVLNLVTSCSFARIVAVTRTEEVYKLCKNRKVDVIFHEYPNRNDTVRLGLEYIMKEVDACLFCPCDQPLLTKETMQHMIFRFQEGEKGILRLSHKEKEGTPIIFDKKYFEELLALPEKKGGGYVVKQHPEDVERWEASHEWELFDIDTREDYEYLQEISDFAIISAEAVLSLNEPEELKQQTKLPETGQTIEKTEGLL